MAKNGSLDPSKSDSSDDEPQDGVNSRYGNSPVVDTADMTAENRVISSIEQAIEITDLDILDARKLINNAKKITAKKNGAPPYNPKTLKDQGKSGSKRNISTRFLQKELNRCAPRLYMPILSASTLTAASLPAGWPKGQEKTQFFRDTITQSFRGWRKNDAFWRGMAQEVCDFGFGFAAFPDGPYEWRPSLCRMDRGFVPRGTEIMEEKLARFTLKVDYKPNELLKLARDSIDAGGENWMKDSVAAAVDAANLPRLPQDMSHLRKWEELQREQSWDYNHTKSNKVIQTRHLFVLEFTGKVSHYILWPDGNGDQKLLFEHLDAYDGTDSVVIPLTFGYGDGTIHGSWGAGQLLYDLAAQVEKIRCDAMDNLLNSNKARLQVANAKDAAAAQLVINDTMIIASGATFAQNVGGITGNPEGYLTMDNRMTQWAQEIVGSYLPPMPRQASKAAAEGMGKAIENEEQIQKDVLENWLKQVALVIAQMIKRMLDPDSDDPYAIAVRKKLLGEVGKNIPPPPTSLTKDEIDMLVDQPVVQSVMDFTEYAASQRGGFAASVQNNPLFRQDVAARFMACGVPSAGSAFADSICVPNADNSSMVAQQRQQEIESVTMAITKKALGVIPLDNHWIHWGALEPYVENAIKGGNLQVATAALQHLAAHFAAGQSTKTWPPDQINSSKAQIATLQRALEAKTQEVAQAQQQQQAQAAQQQPPGGMAPVVPMQQPQMQPPMQQPPQMQQSQMAQ